MTLTSKIYNTWRQWSILLTGVVCSLWTGQMVMAQETLVLSVSPTLFEMTANQNQNWSSSVRVINANPFPITVYAEPVNFAAEGEDGLGTLTPVFEAVAEGQTLAEWITVNDTEITIPPEQTISVPFTISVPDEAPPGGHFAAILIGTRPLNTTNQQSQVETSQVVTSLVFLRVAGDVVEDGSIREFTTSHNVYEYSDASFDVRFENKGNVHIQPQGEIEIRNMWGNERGRVPINQHSQFGNVLPESIRTYTFTWTADWSWADVGRNSATISLAYGSEARQFVSATTYFWIIPWKLLLLALVLLGGTLAIIIWGIKLYVRKMLQLAGVTPELQQAAARSRSVSVTAPIEAGILDLRDQLQSGQGSLWYRVWQIGKRYKSFSLVALATLVFIGLIVWYAVLVVQNDFSYTVAYEQPNGSAIELPAVTSTSYDEVARIGDGIAIRVVNQSNDSGLSEAIVQELRDQAYKVTTKDEIVESAKNRSVIVYDPAYLDVVEAVSDIIPQALVSAYVREDDSEPPITIYLGTDVMQ